MPDLMMLASGVGLVAATAALWAQGGRRADRRLFAGLTSIAVTLSLFSFVAWAVTAIAPLPLTWVIVGTDLKASRALKTRLFGDRRFESFFLQRRVERTPESWGVAEIHHSAPRYQQFESISLQQTVCLSPASAFER